MIEQVSTLLMFGATGDLARRTLPPSLFALDADGLLPEQLRIIGTSRTALGRPGFPRPRAGGAGRASPGRIFHRRHCRLVSLARLHYVALDINDGAAFRSLAQAVGDPADGVAIFSCQPPRRCSSRRSRDLPPRALPHRPCAWRSKAARHRLEVEPRDQRCGRRRLPRTTLFPHRPLSRQGDRPEPPRAALRQYNVRAAVEFGAHRPCPDHRCGDGRARGSRRLL